MKTENKSAISQLNRTPLLDFTIDALRKAVLNGEIGSGERLNEVSFTSRLGISRTTFREALRQLEQEGLLVRIPFRGTFVRQFTEEELKELNNLRGVLEAYAAEVIINIGKNQSDDLEPLYVIIKKMEKINPEKDVEKANEFHISFHREILNLANNKLLFSVWNILAQQFWVALRLSQLSYISRGEASSFTSAHLDVIKAIQTGDIELVRRVFHEHVSNAITQSNNPHNRGKSKKISD